MTFVRLDLALEPLPTYRTPDKGDTSAEHGFALRLSDGALLAHSDPLLAAFATSVIEVIGTDEDDETLQRESFAPGRELALVPEGMDEDGDDVVGVWDAERVSRAGVLPYRLAATVVAGEEHGLRFEAVALSEHRTRRDDRRCDLTVVVAPKGLVTLDRSAAATAAPHRRPSRPRLVLVADGGADLRWWDPSASSGPIALTDVPVSADLAAELAGLSAAYAAREPAGGEPEDFFGALEDGWARGALETRVRTAWIRARTELGRRYAVGLLTPGMSRPAWSPGELPGDEDDDLASEVPF